MSEMPLSMVSEGDSVKLVEIKAGWGLVRRLTDMGLTPGTVIKVVNKQGAGPMLIEVRGSRLALGRGICHHIRVTDKGA